MYFAEEKNNLIKGDMYGLFISLYEFGYISSYSS